MQISKLFDMYYFMEGIGEYAFCNAVFCYILHTEMEAEGREPSLKVVWENTGGSPGSSKGALYGWQFYFDLVRLVDERGRWMSIPIPMLKPEYACALLMRAMQTEGGFTEKMPYTKQDDDWEYEKKQKSFREADKREEMWKELFESVGIMTLLKAVKDVSVPYDTSPDGKKEGRTVENNLILEYAQRHNYTPELYE